LHFDEFCADGFWSVLILEKCGSFKLNICNNFSQAEEKEGLGPLSSAHRIALEPAERFVLTQVSKAPLG
jgi:hypothetical protein